MYIVLLLECIICLSPVPVGERMRTCIVLAGEEVLATRGPEVGNCRSWRCCSGKINCHGKVS